MDDDVTFLETSRGRFGLLERGRRGDPVVFCLHGFPDSARTFTALLDRLAHAGYHAVAPWLRGYAPSPTDGALDGASLVADLVAQVDAIAPARAAMLVGHDFGALVTYRALVEHPARFARAVTLAVPHPAAWRAGLAHHPAQLLRSTYVAFFQIRGLSEWLVARRDFAAIDWMWRAASPTYQPAPGYLREVKHTLARSWPAPLRMYRAGGFATRDPVTVPVLAIHGADDGVIRPVVTAGQERYLGQGSRHEILAGAGHFVHLERPDTTAELVIGWLGQDAAATIDPVEAARGRRRPESHERGDRAARG
jgi:pimeloyl-ACP methyl ester carboxylesterase